MDYFKTEDSSRRTTRHKLLTANYSKGLVKLEYGLSRALRVNFVKVKYFRLWQVKFLKEDISHLKTLIKKTNRSLLAWAFRNFNLSKQAQLRHAFYYWRLLRPQPKLTQDHFLLNSALVIVAAFLATTASRQAFCNFARPAVVDNEWASKKKSVALCIWRARTMSPSPYLLRNLQMLSQTVSSR
jgi:hypothetical protein